ncbi:MAG: hypothetical protein L3K13_08005 [Thermoplasmata archaeon]|nr:hypothetical protein [Thermoplasmata archaeon]
MEPQARAITEQDIRGVNRLAIGAGLGVAGGVLAVVLPIAFLLVSTYYPGGFFTFSSTFVEVTSVLLLAGALLFLFSLFAYRRAFVALRKVDHRFVGASVLCLVGSLGFLLLVLSSVALLGSSSSLLACLHGQPSHALSCVRSSSPLGAYTGLAGFWLGWLGGLGIVSGLFLGARRFRRRSLAGGGILYTLLLLVLIAPFVDLVYSFEGAQYALLAAPFLVLLAPALVYGGSRAPPTSARS